MGTGNDSLGTLYLNGKPVADFSIDGDTLKIEEYGNTPGPLIAAAFGPVAMSMRVSLPKEWRCRSRKRFVKLLMSCGHPRNQAAHLADIVARSNILSYATPRSYQDALFQAIYLSPMYWEKTTD